MTIELHPNVKAALVHPLMGMEMRGWLKTHHPEALAWRGEDGETMMHWAFMSDWHFARELFEAGLPFDLPDRHGRTPFDWLNDRLYSAIVDPKTNTKISKGGQERLIQHTENQIMYLWSAGMRPPLRTPFYGAVWLQAGAFNVLEMVLVEHGYQHWTPDGGTMLHALVLAPNTPQRMKWLSKLVSELGVDVADLQGRTALWYCADTWLNHPSLRASMKELAHQLRQFGADPDLKAANGLSPLDVLSFDQVSNQGQDYQDMLAVMDNLDAE